MEEEKKEDRKVERKDGKWEGGRKNVQVGKEQQYVK